VIEAILAAEQLDEAAPSLGPFTTFQVPCAALPPASADPARLLDTVIL